MSRDFITGRTRTDGHWDTVLYQLPQFSPTATEIFFKPGINAALHVRMNLHDKIVGLGPINVHSPGHISGTWQGLPGPVVEVRNILQPITFEPGAQDPRWLGTVQVPIPIDINENSTLVGALPGAEPLGHIAVFALQAISDVHNWFRLLSLNGQKGGPEYCGFGMELFLLRTPGGSPTTTSWPLEAVPRHTLFLEGAHFDTHSVIAHEYAHQMSYELGLTFGTSTEMTGIPFDIRGEIAPPHGSEKLTTPDVALLEGWAEFVEAVFGRDMVSALDRFWKKIPPYNTPPGLTPDWTDLWDAPGAGELIEGCVARAFFDAYRVVHNFHPTLAVAVITNQTTNPADPGWETTEARVFVDANRNRAFDPGETPLYNVQVEFLADNNEVVGTPSFTNRNGFVTRRFGTGGVRNVRIVFGFYPNGNLTRTVLPVSPAVTEIVQGFFFDDENYNGLHNADEAPLRDIPVEFVTGGGAVVVSPNPTDVNGMYSHIYSYNPSTPNDQIAAVRVNQPDQYPYPLVIPAALTQTSRLDSRQVNLRPVLPYDIPNATGKFYDLFYNCWIPPISYARELYERMLTYAHNFDQDFYHGIREIFWDNNMMLPEVQISLGDGENTFNVSIRDRITRNTIPGRFGVQFWMSANPNDWYATTGSNLDIQGPRVGVSVMATTENNGELTNQHIDINDRAAVLIIEVNVRDLIPRATATNHDVWIRGAWHTT
jgi:hypothetical protein